MVPLFSSVSPVSPDPGPMLPIPWIVMPAPTVSVPSPCTWRNPKPPLMSTWPPGSAVVVRLWLPSNNTTGSEPDGARPEAKVNVLLRTRPSSTETAPATVAPPSSVAGAARARVLPSP